MRAISAFKPARKFLVMVQIPIRLGGGQSLYVSHSQGKLMRTITLFLFAALAVTSIDAASYEQNDGTIVDPILDIVGDVLSYVGPNLEPSANLSSANLLYASLPGANLESADLTGADLFGASLIGADLTDADLTGAYLRSANLKSANLSSANLTNASGLGVNLRMADLSGANLSSAYLLYASLPGANLRAADLHYADLTSAYLGSADLTDANLSGSILTDTEFYIYATWTDAFYYTDNEPTWDSGMDAAWRTSAGILALAPTSAVPEPSTILLALLGLALLPRRRRR